MANNFMAIEGGDVHKPVSGGCAGIIDHLSQPVLPQMIHSKEQIHSHTEARAGVIKTH